MLNLYYNQAQSRQHPKRGTASTKLALQSSTIPPASETRHSQYTSTRLMAVAKDDGGDDDIAIVIIITTIHHHHYHHTNQTCTTIKHKSSHHPEFVFIYTPPNASMPQVVVIQSALPVQMLYYNARVKLLLTILERDQKVLPVLNMMKRDRSTASRCHN